jgi:Skp family chaperone for outer membrane proteins
MRANRILLAVLASLLLAAAGHAQVAVKRGAVVYVGSASNTSAPAIVDEAKLRDATSEWQRIQNEGIDPDSAQGKQLIVRMNQRIRDAVKSIAESQGRDMVVRKGDITDRQGRDVVDLTDQVVSRLGE